VNAPSIDPKPPRRRLRSGFILGLLGGLVFVAVDRQGSPRAATSDMPAPIAPKVMPLERGERAVAAVEAAIKPVKDAEWAIPAAAIDFTKAAVTDKQLVQVLDDGTAVELTLDPLLQQTAQDLLARYRVERGVIIAIRPKTGEILAMAEVADGQPSFRQVALQAAGPAASTFKLITSSALLTSGKLKPEDSICVHGGESKLTLYNLKANPRFDTKCETLGQALGSSNNVAFARWADQLLRPADLQATADRFLFGKRLPFVWTVGVSQARIPTASRLGFARSAAGFEGSFASPLHMALVEAAIANHGTMMAPMLVRRATRDQGKTVVYEREPQKLTQALEPAIADQVQQLTAFTTTEGTGRKYFQKGNKARLAVTVGGKSGSLSAKEEQATRFYSWFVASAPLEDSEIAVAALVVQGEQWTVKGAVLARDLLESYFSRSGRAVRELEPEPQVQGDPLDE